MKKICTLIITCFLVISLSACQNNSKNKEDILTFFDALDNTLQLNQANIEATLNMNDQIMDIHAQINQKDSLQVKAKMDLEANGNTQKNFLAFYIKDGKTYLNSMGTKTQSTVDKIGLKENSKLNLYNPFLDFSDDDLVACFNSSSKKGNEYHFDVNTSKLATLLDNFGTISLDEASLDATIQNKKIKKMTLSFKGTQSLNDQTSDIDVNLSLTLKKYKNIQFPNDLDAYEKTAEN